MESSVRNPLNLAASADTLHILPVATLSPSWTFKWPWNSFSHFGQTDRLLTKLDQQGDGMKCDALKERQILHCQGKVLGVGALMPRFIVVGVNPILQCQNLQQSPVKQRNFIFEKLGEGLCSRSCGLVTRPHYVPPLSSFTSSSSSDHHSGKKPNSLCGLARGNVRAKAHKRCTASCVLPCTGSSNKHSGRGRDHCGGCCHQVCHHAGRRAATFPGTVALVLGFLVNWCQKHSWTDFF